MSRFLLGVGLLLIFLSVGLWVANASAQTSEAIAQTLTLAADTALAGDLNTGKQLAQKARQDWDSQWHATASVADHAPMDEIDGLFGQLSAYEQANAATEFAACCARLSQLVTAIGEAHGLTWWNLL